MDLRHKTVLITGGSRGLGRGLGHSFAEAGARVILVARDPEPLAAAVQGVRDAGGIAHGIVADVADKRAAHRIAGQAAGLAGPVDILVNNASSLGPTPLRLLLDTECEDLERVLQVNVVGPFRLTKIIAGSMALRGAGTVINISSDAAVSAYETWGSYSASKAAQDHLTRIWAEELEGVGVRFVAVDPGEMNTQMHADAIPDANPHELADPRAVAHTIVAMCTAPAEARSGSRLVAPEWEVGHGARA